MTGDDRNRIRKKGKIVTRRDEDDEFEQRLMEIAAARRRLLAHSPAQIDDLAALYRTLRDKNRPGRRAAASLYLSAFGRQCRRRPKLTVAVALVVAAAAMLFALTGVGKAVGRFGGSTTRNPPAAAPRTAVTQQSIATTLPDRVVVEESTATAVPRRYPPGRPTPAPSQLTTLQAQPDQRPTGPGWMVNGHLIVARHTIGLKVKLLQGELTATVSSLNMHGPCVWTAAFGDRHQTQTKFTPATAAPTPAKFHISKPTRSIVVNVKHPALPAQASPGTCAMLDIKVAGTPSTHHTIRPGARHRNQSDQQPQSGNHNENHTENDKGRDNEDAHNGSPTPSASPSAPVQGTTQPGEPSPAATR